ncbi:MAG: hypothetical protein GY700_01485, partial [Propionibacteriaceae bacterium]|nr:hypothetical protein [Propionibacteriaceae bacterium]
MADLSQQVLTAPTDLLQVVPDLIQHGTGNALPEWFAGPGSQADTSGNWFQQQQAGFREYTPLLADIGTSLTDTLDVVGIQGDQDHIVKRYQDAVAEGRWIAEALEDV